MSRPSPGTETALDSSLIEAFNAYREGLRRQPRARPYMPPRDFDALMFLGTIGQVKPQDRLWLRRLYLACGRGLAAARQGRLDESHLHYLQAADPLDRLLHGTRAGWLVGVSTYQAGVAYLDLRRGCAERARERLELVLDADLELERAGLPVVQMHRIQQGHNLVRMDLRLGRRESAIGLAGALVAYMERLADGLPYHRGWQPRALQAVPRGLLRAMIHQVAGETAGFIVTGAAPDLEWRGLLATAGLCREADAAVFPQVQYALRARHDRLLDDREGYLRNLGRFFHLGIRDCHLVWYPVMVELAAFCGELDTARSRQVQSLIARDAARWRGLPSALRERLDSAAPRRSVA